MKLPRFEREVVEDWIAGVNSNMRWIKRGDHHKRQGGLLGGILNGGTALIGDILNGGNSKTTTTAAQPPRTTNVVSNPPPATTAAPAPTQAPPATTQAPAPAPPVATTAPNVVIPPVQVTTVPAPISQQPISSSVPVNKPSTNTVAIPILTATLIPTVIFPGNGALPTTVTISAVPPPSSLPSSSILSTGIPSSVTSFNPSIPTTFATSTLSTSTNTVSEDLRTMNPIMGGSMSGMGGIGKMTIIISVLSILFGSIVIFLICFFISKNYIKKRKITIAMDMRISQLQQGDGPLPPVPMRMRMKNDAMEFMLRFPRPPSLRRMGRHSKEREREGFEVIR